MDRAELEGLDRESLVARAQAAGIRRARILTRPELVDELLRLDPNVDPMALRRSRGFFGVARDLLARVVERGLHLPDAADRLRAALNTPLPEIPRPEPQAVPTVTLAEIYAAQGHKERAIDTLERVLEREPDHAAARGLLDRLRDVQYVAPAPKLPPEPEVEEPLYAAAAEDDVDEESVDTEDFAGEEASLEEVDASPAHEEPGAAVTLPSHPAPMECIAIPGPDQRSMYVWWRVDTGLVDGPFVVRVLVVTPTWDGPREEIRDVSCDPLAGSLTLSDLPERAVVRVAVGFVRERAEGESDDAFVPLAHSPALETTPRTGGLVRWTIDGAVPIALDDPRAASIARAVERARTALGAPLT